MAASIDAKDPLTATHSANVKKYSQGIGVKLGFSKKDLEILGVAAMLHDYGKLGIRESILTKPGRLSSHEYEQV